MAERPAGIGYGMASALLYYFLYPLHQEALEGREAVEQGAAFLGIGCYARGMAHPRRGRLPATYEDLSKVPDHLVAEILDGELYATPRPGPRHADASSGLGGALRGPFDRGRGGPGGWRILDEPELHLTSDVLVPDLAGWRRDRMPRLPDETHFSLAPDWICEVISPSTAATDRVQKLTIYARAGVPHAWLVDPIARTLEVLRLTNGRWTIVSTWAGLVVARAEPFDAIDLDLSLLWEDDAAESPLVSQPR